jgi:hypothetical protein
MKKKSMFALVFAMLLMAPSFVSAQAGQGLGTGIGSGSSDEQAATTQKEKESRPVTRVEEAVAQTQAIAQLQNPRFVRSLTNVQVELTLTDQVGTQAPEKKTVSMIVSSGNWGKIRSAGQVRPQNGVPFVADLNIDARPYVSVDGPIQLELTMVYSPPGGADKDNLKTQPTGVNQSLTVILQSGKPLVISQAADPVSDRKVIVEVKATVLK